MPGKLLPGGGSTAGAATHTALYAKRWAVCIEGSMKKQLGVIL